MLATRIGDPRHEIVAAVAEGIAVLIVDESDNKAWVSRMLLGSSARGVLDSKSCDILVCRLILIGRSYSELSSVRFNAPVWHELNRRDHKEQVTNIHLLTIAHIYPSYAVALARVVDLSLSVKVFEGHWVKNFHRF